MQSEQLRETPWWQCTSTFLAPPDCLHSSSTAVTAGRWQRRSAPGTSSTNNVVYVNTSGNGEEAEVPAQLMMCVIPSPTSNALLCATVTPETNRKSSSFVHSPSYLRSFSTRSCCSLGSMLAAFPFVRSSLSDGTTIPPALPPCGVASESEEGGGVGASGAARFFGSGFIPARRGLTAPFDSTACSLNSVLLLP
eukprot:CAMPEP_0180415160 /NCGR_PEP_ID=MMETSP0989-20121125/46052_1 /TAXON_ID=697907 /ORGANISM="non described non described, Strain CCMP2293" /LENGTH=193 /DNA_ID=CAMNT_0022419927 /DNA_START=93 /DNA_END=670 /DNA_ORIENTATION=-